MKPLAKNEALSKDGSFFPGFFFYCFAPILESPPTIIKLEKQTNLTCSDTSPDFCPTLAQFCTTQIPSSRQAQKFSQTSHSTPHTTTPGAEEHHEVSDT